MHDMLSMSYSTIYTAPGAVQKYISLVRPPSSRVAPRLSTACGSQGINLFPEWESYLVQTKQGVLELRFLNFWGI